MKNDLQAFFLAGGSGTNSEIASMLNSSLEAVRSTISVLRAEGIPIEKNLPVRKGEKLHAVYRISRSVDPIEVKRGRPAHVFKYHQG